MTTIALAGRRIDAPETTVRRFPLEMIPTVQQRLRDLFLERGATALVCSGACGADLLALAVASELQLRRRMVLPFDPVRFRATSVTDRAGDWGPLFDRLVDELVAQGDLVILPPCGESTSAYAAANAMILEEASQLTREESSPSDILAVIVWEGAPRGEDDLTAAFAQAAAARQWEIMRVLTR